jgi:hypothetical protein
MTAATALPTPPAPAVAQWRPNRDMHLSDPLTRALYTSRVLRFDDDGRVRVLWLT